MAYEHKEGTGALFTNTKTKDSQPDVKGNIMINGTVYKLAGWLKKRNDGSDWISLVHDDKAPATASGGLSAFGAPSTNDVP
jgi:hypothetical protein